MKNLTLLVDQLKADLYLAKCLLDAAAWDAGVGLLAQCATRLAQVELMRQHPFEARRLSAILDRLCLRAAQAFLASIPDYVPPSRQRDATDRRLVVLATQMYAIGGHTACAVDLFASGQWKGGNVLLTTPADASGAEALRERLDLFVPGVSAAIGIHSRPADTGLLWIVDAILSTCPDELILFHHPDDVWALIAAMAARLIDQRSNKSPSFRSLIYMHSDTCAFVGATASHFEHIAFKSSQLSFWQDALPVDAVRWVLPLTSAPNRQPLPQDPLPKSVSRLIGRGEDQVLTLSCGTANKIAARDDSPDFGDVLAYLLRAGAIEHVHVGPLSEAQRLGLRNQVSFHGGDPGRLHFIETTRHLPTLLKRLKVNAVVCTVPLGGSRTAIDAMSVGVPLLAPAKCSKLLSESELLPAKTDCWSSLEEIQAWAETASVENLAGKARTSRAHYEENFSGKIYLKSLTQVLASRGGAQWKCPLKAPRRVSEKEQQLAQSLAIGTSIGLSAKEIETEADHLALFDVLYYQLFELDDLQYFASPLLHFLRHVDHGGVNPHPLVCMSWLVEQRKKGLPSETLGRLADGHSGLDPHPVFSRGYYLGANRDVREAGLDAFLHYIEFGFKENTRAIHPLFSREYYLANQLGRPQLVAAPIDALSLYLVRWRGDSKSPHYAFDISYYLQVSDRLRLRSGRIGLATDFDPISHFQLIGKHASINPHPLISIKHLSNQLFQEHGAGADALASVLSAPVTECADPHPLFDSQAYCELYPDIVEAGVRPLQHYLTWGYQERRKFHPDLEADCFQGNAIVPPAKGSALENFILAGCLKWSFRRIDQDLSDTLRLVRELAFRNAHESQLIASFRKLRGFGPAHQDHYLDCGVFQLAAPPRSEPDGKEERLVLSKPKIYSSSAPLIQTAEYESPGFCMMTLQHAHCIGGSSIVLQGTSAISARHASMQSCDELVTNDAVIDVADGKAVVQWANEPAAIIAEAVHLCHEGGGSFEHWFLEALPRLATLQADQPLDADVPVLINLSADPWIYEATRMLCGESVPLIPLAAGHRREVSRLIYPSATNWRSSQPRPENSVDRRIYIEPDALARFGAQLQNMLGQRWPDLRCRPTRRLFVFDEQANRRFANVPEVLQIAAQLGFEVLNSRDLSLAELLQEVRGSGMVVGFKGRSMAACLVAGHPDALYLVLESEHAVNGMQYWSTLAALCGVNMRWLTSQGERGSGAARKQVIPERILRNMLLHLGRGDWLGCNAPMQALFEFEAYTPVLTAAAGLRAAQVDAYYWRERERLLERSVQRIRESFAAEDAEEKVLQTFQAIYSHALFTHRVAHIVSARHNHGLPPELCRLRDESLQLIGRPEVALAVLAPALLFGHLLARNDQYPLIPDPTSWPLELWQAYLAKVLNEHYATTQAEDTRCVEFSVSLLQWMDQQLDSLPRGAHFNALLDAAQQLNLNELYLLDVDLSEVIRARAQLIGKLTTLLPGAQADQFVAAKRGKRTAGGGRRIRVGVLCRTFHRGPDSESVLAAFSQAPADKYELFAYTVDFQDRMIKKDADFDAKFRRVFPHRRILQGPLANDISAMRRDELDFFVLANATRFGISDLDLLLSHRVAPVQIGLNSILPAPTGLPSFDYFITGAGGAEVREAGAKEKFIELPTAPICFMKRKELDARRVVGRKQLGIPEQAIVFYCSAAAVKLRERSLKLQLQVLKASPDAYLVIAAFNPGWSGRFHQLPFETQLDRLCQELEVPRSRVVLLAELTMDEAHDVQAMADIYLAPFPHGGATSSTMFMYLGGPVVVLRRETSRSIDQFLVESIGLSELVARTPEQYVKIASELARKPDYLQRVRSHLAERIPGAGFYDATEHSQAIMKVLQSLEAQALGE